MALGIPTTAETARSLRGSWQLFLGRPDAMRHFDTSFDGFWRSFGVFALLVPLNAVLVLTEMRLIQASGRAPVEDFPLAAFAFWKYLNLALDLVLFPLVLAILSGLLQVQRTYVRYVVARNWCIPLALSITLVPAMLYASGLIGQVIAELLLFAAIVIVLRYHYMVMRAALQTGMGTTLGLVAMDVALSLVVSALITRASGVA